jgi:hypothetical protein
VVHLLGAVEPVGLALVRRGIGEDRGDQPALVFRSQGRVAPAAKWKADHSMVHDRSDERRVEEVLREEGWAQMRHGHV